MFFSVNLLREFFHDRPTTDLGIKDKQNTGYTGEIPQRSDTDVHSAVTAKTSTAL